MNSGLGPSMVGTLEMAVCLYGDRENDAEEGVCGGGGSGSSLRCCLHIAHETFALEGVNK